MIIDEPTRDEVSENPGGFDLNLGIWICRLNPMANIFLRLLNFRIQTIAISMV